MPQDLAAQRSPSTPHGQPDAVAAGGAALGLPSACPSHSSLSLSAQGRARRGRAARAPGSGLHVEDLLQPSHPVNGHPQASHGTVGCTARMRRPLHPRDLLPKLGSQKSHFFRHFSDWSAPHPTAPNCLLANRMLCVHSPTRTPPRLEASGLPSSPSQTWPSVAGSAPSSATSCCVTMGRRLALSEPQHPQQ